MPVTSIKPDAQDHDGNPEPQVVRESPGPRLSLQYVALANRVLSLRQDASISKTIGVASCLPKEGTTTVSTNLAIGLAGATSTPVLLVQTDADGRRTRMASEPGWAELLAGRVDPAEVIRPARCPGLSVIGSGDVQRGMAKAVEPRRVRDVIASLKEQFDLVVFDLPDANELTTCYPVASALDGVILVVQAGRTDTRRVRRMRYELAQVGGHVVGVVLNKQRTYSPKWLRQVLPFTAPVR